VRQVVVAERFNGPPGSGNGGYVCGTLAALVGTGPVAVRLLRPPRIGVPHSVDGGRLLDSDAVVAKAAVWTDDRPELPPAVLPADAEAASQRFAGYVRHPFPSCFGCCTDRADGLEIFPGPVAGTTSVAAPWCPGPSLAVAGSPCAAPAGVQGRRRCAVSAVRTTTGELVAWSRQTWVEVN
jgi:hypothetical protein